MSTNGHFKMPQDLLIQAKYEEQQLTKARCKKRINCIIDIVNKHLLNISIISNNNINQCFQINQLNENIMINNILVEIGRWEGSQYHSKTDSIKLCHQKVRQWWNRGKSFKLADFIFQPMFISILNFLAELTEIQERQKLMVFIDIFSEILQSKIKYNKRTMARPVIPQQIYLKKNNYKLFCQRFLAHFDSTLNWNGFNNIKISGQNDKHRSLKLSDSLLQCLRKMKAKLIERNEDDINHIQMDKNIKISEWTKHLFLKDKLLSVQQLKFESINQCDIYHYTQCHNDNNNNNNNDDQDDIDMINNNNNNNNMDQIKWINSNNDNYDKSTTNSVWNEMMNYRVNDDKNKTFRKSHDDYFESGSRNHRQISSNIVELNNKLLLNLFPTINSVLNGTRMIS